MTYQEMLQNARGNIGPYCKACPVCNGLACKNQIPGPGAEEGVGVLVDKLAAELKDTMRMCGATKLSEISRDMLWNA